MAIKELSLDKFEEAYNTVQQVVLPTNLVYSEFLSAQTGNKVYLKPENMQLTGAYKIRGAYYKISTLSDAERAKGLITASAGNHAQGVAYAAQLDFAAPEYGSSEKSLQDSFHLIRQDWQTGEA